MFYAEVIIHRPSLFYLCQLPPSAFESNLLGPVVCRCSAFRAVIAASDLIDWVVSNFEMQLAGSWWYVGSVGIGTAQTLRSTDIGICRHNFSFVNNDPSLKFPFAVMLTGNIAQLYASSLIILAYRITKLIHPRLTEGVNESSLPVQAEECLMRAITLFQDVANNPSSSPTRKETTMGKTAQKCLETIIKIFRIVTQAESSRESADAATATHVIGSFTSCSTDSERIQPDTFQSSQPASYNKAADPGVERALEALIGTFQQPPNNGSGDAPPLYDRRATTAHSINNPNECSTLWRMDSSTLGVDGTGAGSSESSFLDEPIVTPSSHNHNNMLHLSTEALLSTGDLFDTVGIDNMWSVYK
jgi:hypothetical protein